MSKGLSVAQVVRLAVFSARSILPFSVRCDALSAVWVNVHYTMSYAGTCDRSDRGVISELWRPLARSGYP